MSNCSRPTDFTTPSAGRIFVDGRDISELDPGSYRKNLSLVAQESTLYDGTSHIKFTMDYC